MHDGCESRLVDFERAGCSALGVHHRLDDSKESVIDFRPIRPDRERQVDEVGDDVCRRAAVNTRAGDDGEVFRSHFFGDEVLQRHDNVAGGEDGIAAQVLSRGVAAFA